MITESGEEKKIRNHLLLYLYDQAASSMKKLTTWFLFGILLFPSVLIAQSEYKYQSVFMYNFTKYIQWPDGLRNGDFVIGVYGNSAITNELERQVANKIAGSQKIVVKQINSAIEGEKCHILFIPNSESNSFENLQSALKSKPVLVVTEKEGLCKKGSIINFIHQEGRMRFELNQNAALGAGLKVSSQLANMAISNTAMGNAIVRTGNE